MKITDEFLTALGANSHDGQRNLWVPLPHLGPGAGDLVQLRPHPNEKPDSWMVQFGLTSTRWEHVVTVKDLLDALCQLSYQEGQQNQRWKTAETLRELMLLNANQVR